jgi:hypothetical protein
VDVEQKALTRRCSNLTSVIHRTPSNIATRVVGTVLAGKSMKQKTTTHTAIPLRMETITQQAENGQTG